MSLSEIQQRIHSCDACPRLRKHCREIAKIKKRAYRRESYWGNPISGFGDPQARLVIVGLAPGAHGANRTGRVFTGDRSGDWLYRSLYRAGFANQPQSLHSRDGLILKNAYVTCVVKCAPPDNKPSPTELHQCTSHLKEEISKLTHTKVWMALGQIALNGLWPLISPASEPRPKFIHGKEIELAQGQRLILSYHPSQQNTFTGRLTEPMFDSVFSRSRLFI